MPSYKVYSQRLGVNHAVFRFAWSFEVSKCDKIWTPVRFIDSLQVSLTWFSLNSRVVRLQAVITLAWIIWCQYRPFASMDFWRNTVGNYCELFVIPLIHSSKGVNLLYHHSRVNNLTLPRPVPRVEKSESCFRCEVDNVDFMPHFFAWTYHQSSEVYDS